MISVIIPTWNPKKYFYDLIDSLKNQTINNSLYEIIIIFNNTNSDIVELYSEYANRNLSNLKIINIPDPGVSLARNIGLDNALGDFICFLDDDDIISHNYLENLYSLKDKNSIVVSNVLSFTEGLDKPKKDYLTFEKDFSSINILKYRSYFSTVWGKLIPRNLVGNFRFNQSLKNGEDALFMYSFSYKVEKILSTSPSTIYYRRVRIESASRRKRKKYEIISNSLYQIKLYTKIFFYSKNRYSSVFLLNRYMAIIKKLLIDLGLWK